jgi:hypothetical protein
MTAAFVPVLAGALLAQPAENKLEISVTPLAINMPGSPFGVAWAFLYGYSGMPAANYLPSLREVGAGLTKVYLFWQQLEPEKGHFDWTALDTFAAQLNSPDEGLVSLFSSSQWATKRPSAMLPPSPAEDLEEYYRFVYEMVNRCKGRVRYWQNDSEPNNPVFWSGTKEEFVEQLRVFCRAVKAADPAAIVVVGGYDGLFIPPGIIPLPGQRATPYPQQDAGLAFFEYVLKEGASAFDVFDLRLYGDPYTIVPRVDYLREKMRSLGADKPIICTEYGGPNLFEFPENRPYISFVTTWSQAVQTTDEKGNPTGDTHSTNRIGKLYRDMPTLAPQTQMFMQGCTSELDAKHRRIQSRSLVIRNLLALSDGVQKTLYWQLLDYPGPRDDLMTLMYGKIGLLGYENGGLNRRSSTAEVFARMARTLTGVRSVARIPCPDRPSIFLFNVDRGERGPLYVVWERRDAFSGEDLPSVVFACHWSGRTATAVDTFGAVVPTSITEQRLMLSISDTPIYVEPRD